MDGATNVVVEAEKENAVEEPWLDNLDMAIGIYTCTHHECRNNFYS